MDTQEKLEKLFDYQCQLDALELQRQDARASILTPELQAQLAAIDDEFDTKQSGARNNIAELTEQIKLDILSGGKSIKSDHLMAVYLKGRSGGWDNDKLLGYSIAYPEILIAKKADGEPTVSIRSV